MTTFPPSFDLPQLSPATIQELKELREGDRQRFLAYVSSLRGNGWPLRAIAEPLGVSRTTVQDWQKKFKGQHTLPVTEKLPEALPKEVKTRYNRTELTDREKLELHMLAHEAAKVRRFTDQNAKSRQYAAFLEDLLHEYTKAGISLGKLADACGVSRSSIAQRLRKKQKKKGRKKK